jgi:hypothetical protein
MPSGPWERGNNLYALQFVSAHRHQTQSQPPTLISGWDSDTLALQSYDIIALRLQPDYTEDT